MKKKFFKKISVGLLAFMMILSLTSVTNVFAVDDTYPLVTVNSEDITTATNNTIVCGSGTAVYDVGTKTLTLNNATITSSDGREGAGIFSQHELNIVVNGKNVIQAPVGVRNFGALNISGNGSLNVQTEFASFSPVGNMSINDCTIVATAEKSNAFYVDGGTLSISDGDVTATGSYPGLFSTGNISISDSNIVANSTEDWGIWSQANLTISGDSDVTANGATGNAGGFSGFNIIPKLNESVEVFVGTDADNVTAVQGSPFSAETNLKALNIGNNNYFHSKTHIHTYETTLSKDANKHWYASTCGHDVKKDEEAHTFGEWVIDTEATETEKGSKYRDCSVCEHRETEEIPVTGETPTNPTITVGGGFNYQISAGKDLTLTCSGKLEDLAGIYVDGNLVDPSNYTLKSGSTILTLKTSYLDTLSAGKHTLKFQYKDNVSAETEFTITAKAETTKPSSPQTGDASNTMLYFGLIALSGCVVILGLKNKKALNK